MSEMKHTPGPWRVCGGYTPAYSAIHSERGYIIFGMADASTHREGLLAKPITAPGMDEQRANARLISAAPEMLTALRSARSTLDRLYEGFLHNSEAGCEAWDDASGFEVGRQLDAVIAKAEGRTP